MIDDQYKIYGFKELDDERGNLVVIEGGENIPLDIKRVFYIYGSDETIIRGQHANEFSELVLTNVNGTSKVRLDSGSGGRVIYLDRPRMGLYTPAMSRKDTYDFSSDSALPVLAGTHYNGEEYIKDYKVFQDMVLT